MQPSTPGGGPRPEHACGLDAVADTLTCAYTEAETRRADPHLVTVLTGAVNRAVTVDAHGPEIAFLVLRALDYAG